MKRYFKDMETDEKIEIILNVDDLRYDICDRYYEELMFQQEEEGRLMLGKDSYKYIDIRDNYNSFYLRLRNWRDFIDNLDADYLCEDGIDLYKKIIKLYDKWGNIVIYTEKDEKRQEKLEEQIEEMCVELLEICEKQLHEYEDYSYEDLKEYIKDEIEYNNYGEDLYIIDDDKTKVYEDIAYTKTYK